METVLFCSSIILVLISGYLYFNRKDDKPIVDDYLWQVDDYPVYRPKLAVDAFVNAIYFKLSVVNAPNGQIYLVKK